MSSQSHSESHDEVGHVVPLRLLFGVLGALLFLTVITVAVARVDLGSANLIVALTVALAKAALVLLYFMHLRWDRPFNALVIISSLVLVVLFIIFALVDSAQYEPDMIPTNLPQL